LKKKEKIKPVDKQKESDSIDSVLEARKRKFESIKFNYSPERMKDKKRPRIVFGHDDTNDLLIDQGLYTYFCKY
jgi:hypothetical protein